MVQSPLKRKWRKARRLARRRLESAIGLAHPNYRIPDRYRARDIVGLLRSFAIHDVSLLDLFDPRATLRLDMNKPVPVSHHERYGCFIDIGCLEHVFDTRQCLENCLRMVRPGGTYFLNTPVNGYYSHGLHVFNPQGLVDALELNGFKILYKRYSNRRGKP